MKLTRRALGRVTAAAVLVPAAGLAQTTPAPDTAKRDWLAEARESHAGAARAMARIEVPMAVEPATRFQA